MSLAVGGRPLDARGMSIGTGAGALAFAAAAGRAGSGPAQAEAITSPTSHTIRTGLIAAILARLENLAPQSSNQAQPR